MFNKIILSMLLMMFSLTTVAENPLVVFDTNKGKFVVELYSDKAPNTVNNFLQYVNSGFYDQTIFHRVIKQFMIQGGGFTAGMNQKASNAPIKNESNNGLTNVVGSIAMARTQDPHSATSQFFINTSHNQFLDFQSPDPQNIGYCVFGRVIEGMDTIYAIEQSLTHYASGHSDVPIEDIIMLSVKLQPNTLSH